MLRLKCTIQVGSIPTGPEKTQIFFYQVFLRLKKNQEPTNQCPILFNETVGETDVDM